MKNLIKFLIFCSIIVTLLAFNKTSILAKETITKGDFTYSINGKVATLTKYNGRAKVVEIPSTVNGATVTYIGEKSFYRNYYIVEVKMPNTILAILDGGFDYERMDYVGAFRLCKNLKTIVLSSNMTVIGDSAFNSCTSLNKVKLPTKLKNIKAGAFENCKSLSSLYLPSTVSTLGDYAFKDTGLIKLKIPTSMKKIGFNALSISSLEEITVTKGNKYYTSHEGVLYVSDCSNIIQYPQGKKDDTYTVHENIEILDISMFSYTQNLKTLILSKNIRAFYPISLDESSIEEFAVDERNSRYKAIDGVLFTKNEKKLILYPTAKKDKVYFVPSGVTDIGMMDFFDLYNPLTYLEELYIPSSVERINTVLWKSKALKKVAFASNCKIERLPPAIFSMCNALESIVLPDSISSFSNQYYVHDIGINFSDCINLKSVYIGPNSRIYSQETFASNIFYGCNNLTLYSYGNNHIVSDIAMYNFVKYVDVSKTSDKVLGISFNDTSVAIPKDKTYNINPIIYPSTALNKNVEYSSSDPTIAMVSAEGVVTPIREGTCVITVKALDGSGEYARCQIKIYNKLP